MILLRRLMVLAIASGMIACHAENGDPSRPMDETLGIEQRERSGEEAVAGEETSPTRDGVQPPGEVPPMEDEAVQAEHLLLLEERTRSFRVIDGEENLDTSLPLALRPTRGEEPGEWVLEFSDLNTLYLSVADNGDVMMVRLDLPPEDMFVVYDPPVRMLPAEIRPYEQIEETSVARVHDLETGELEHTGDVEHKVLFASRTRFATDVGVFDGYLIPIEHKIDIPWANVRLELAGGYVPEVGIVYRRMEYTRTTFGTFGKAQRRTAVLSQEIE